MSESIAQFKRPENQSHSNNYVMYCYVCSKAGPDIAGKTKFVTGKKFKRESLVYQNKTKSLKHEKCFNVVSGKNPFLN
jgi:hypothetical protein